MKRIKEAVSEIKKVARKDSPLAAEGAVLFLEKVSPALEHVDSSSGSLGNAVFHAIDALVPIIASADVDRKTREGWLERLFTAHAEDQIPYIEILAEYWGELCASKALASQWADQLLPPTRALLGPGRPPGGNFHGTSACLSALHVAGRYGELVELLEEEEFWPYKQWAAKALAAQGNTDEAIRYAELGRNPWASDHSIDCLCEEILLSAGRADEAYRKYGLRANRAGTYLAWFRAVTKKYGHKSASEILADLVRENPGEEGNWFAAAKSAGLFDEAIELARRSPCAPQTLSRAARDFAERRPEFAIEAGMAALYWLLAGYGYEVTGLDVSEAWSQTMEAARHAGLEVQTRERIRDLVARNTSGERFVVKALERELGRQARPE